MRPFLLLPLLLLGAVSALHLENDALSPDSRETQGDLSQDLEGSGEQKGELALTKDVIQSEGEADKSSRYPNAFEDEEDEESDPSDLEEDFQCPREEDTVQMLGSHGCTNCHYRLVRTPKTFIGAEWLWKKLHWTDGSSWNFVYWALGQPKRGGGHCVTMSTRRGHWRRAHCIQRLPFICHSF
ncbi:proteoglycan 3-like isoform 2-T2 [Hipposideros larvatus]